MATLQQIYRAHLANDPNVSQMVYDPFSWNIEQTFDDTVDDTVDAGGTGGITNVYTGGGGGDAAEDLWGGTNVRLPSSYRETPGLTETYDQSQANKALRDLGYTDNIYDPKIDPADPVYDANLKRLGLDTISANPWANEANLDEAYYGDMDDVNLEPGKQAWFNKMKSNLMGNPLMQGVMAVANPFMAGAKIILQEVGKVLPVNERAILENEALGSGITLDNIGRIVRQEGIDYDDAVNIFAGYNYAQIDEDTFEKRRKSIQNMSPDAKKKRLKAIDAFEKQWRESKIKTSYIVDQKMRAKGKTPLSDQIAINKAKQDFQNRITKDTPDITPKTVVDVVDTAASEDAYTPSSTPHPGLYTPIHSADPPSGATPGSMGMSTYGGGDPFFNKGGRVGYGKGGIVDLL